MISDVQEGITNINWSVYGKILDISKTGDPNVNKIIYEYDASGNRIGKRIKTSSSNSDTTTTWYVRDASGNVMATYEMNVNGGSFTKKYLNEQHLYGSSRLGIYNVQKDLTLNSPATVAVGIIGQADTSKRFVRGKKFFELSNHLGNVLATISDRKLQVAQAAPNGGLVSYYKAIVITANDYYPFGMGMVGRSYTSTVSGNKPYKYGFNGQERSFEIDANGNSNTAEFWQYDARLGRRWNVDPIYKNSRYEVNSSNPIIMIDVLGNDDYWALNPKTGKVTYLGSTSEDRGIKIITTTAEMAMAKDGNLYLQPALVSEYEKTAVLISEFKINWSDEESVQGVSSIISTYAVWAGLRVFSRCEGKVYNDDGEGSPNDIIGISASHAKTAVAYTENHSDIYVTVNSDGFIDSKLSDWGNLTSTLRHENGHRKDKSQLTQLKHSKVILDQLSDEGGVNISDNFKAHLFSLAYNYLLVGSKMEAGNPLIKSLTENFEGLQLIHNVSVSLVEMGNGKEKETFIEVRNKLTGDAPLFKYNPNIGPN